MEKQYLDPTPVSNETSAEFKHRMDTMTLSMVTGAGVAMGMELGLLPLLCRVDHPMSAANMASEVDCHPRYMEEWLKLMQAGDIVVETEYETKAGERLFWLPPDRRQVLSGSTSLIRLIPQLMDFFQELHPRALHCMKTGDSSDAYDVLPLTKSITNWEAGRRKTNYFDNILTNYLWPKEPLIKNMLESGVKVCDIGCGRGTSTIDLAKKFPMSFFTGIDVCEPILVEARTSAECEGITNIAFDNISMPGFSEEWNKSLDIIFIIDCLHDMSFPHETLQDCFEALKPNGILVQLEHGLYSDFKKNLQEPVRKKMAGIYPYINLCYCLQNARCQGEEGMGSTAGKNKHMDNLSKAGFKNVRDIDFETGDYRVDTFLVAVKSPE